jgi:DNA-binding YbaB/EbfC family protein
MGRMPKDMRQLIEQAQKMQEQLAQAQQQLAEKTYRGTAGGGAVTATVKGSGELLAVEFDPAVLDPEDPEMAGDLVVAAVNQALQAAAEEAGQAMGGLGLGGLLG